MKAASNNAKAPSRPPTPADSLAAGVAFMLGLTVVQRLTGFARSVLFCRFLEDDQLGQWSLAFSFLLLAAPLAVLGLPGSFGRYVEYYHQRRQLRQFLWRTSLVSGILAAATLTAVCLMSDQVARVIFNDAGQSRLVLIMTAALATAILFNYLVELLTALRQVRVVSLMQFISSLVFAGAGFALIATTGLGAGAVVVAFAAGYLVASGPALFVLCRRWSDIPSPAGPLRHSDLWSKLLPFAAWVWMVNLLSNLFDAADRYMIIHFAPIDAQAAQALVGQYHSSRVVPALLISVAGMLSGVILPYLSADWEAGRRAEVSRRLNTTLKFVGLAFTAAGALILLTAPLLFDWVLSGKYSDGLAVLPWTLMYCVWFSLGILSQSYLWCAERAWLASLAMSLGLVANIGLNYVLLPHLGLLGAVLATATANAISLLLITLFSRRLGMRLDAGTWLVGLLPLVLCCGGGPACLVWVLLTWLAWRGSWFFTSAEKRQLTEWWERFGRRRFVRSIPGVSNVGSLE